MSSDDGHNSEKESSIESSDKISAYPGRSETQDDEMMGIAFASTNEELQSINEELETAKEEPQSASEELSTVNEELQIKIAELVRDDDGRWHSLQIRPHKTAENKIDGAAITFVDIDEIKRSLEQLTETIRLGTALNEINASINSTLDFDEIMQHMVIDAAGAIGSEAGGVAMRADNRWRISHVYGLPDEAMGMESSDDENQHAMLAIISGKPIVLCESDNENTISLHVAAKYNVRSSLIVPLMVKKQFLGVLFFINRSEAIPFTEAQVDFASKLAASVSLALENSRLFGQLKEAFADVRESRRQVIDILESITDAFFALDSLWRVTYINSNAQQLLGLRKEEILFQSLWEKLPNAQVLHLYKELRLAVERKTAESFEEYVPSLGKWFEFHVYPYDSGLSVYFSDISERKLAEEALNDTIERVSLLADIIEKSSQPFMTSYPDGRPGMPNQAYLDLTGYSAEELRSVSWIEDITPPEWFSFEEQQINELKRTRKPVRYEKEYIRKDGSRIPVEVFRDAEFDEKGDIEFFYAFVTDISERKQDEREHERLLENVVAQTARIEKELEVSNAMLRVAATLGASLDLPTLLQSLADALSAVMGFSRVAIDLSRNPGEVVVAAVHGYPQEFIGRTFDAAIFNPQFGEIAEGKIAISDYDDPLLPEASRKFRESINVLRVIVVPIMRDKKFLGVIVADEPSIKFEFAERDIKLAQGIASQIALSIENAMLYEAKQNAAETLETVVENTNALVAYLDTDMNFIMANDAYVAGSGHTKDEIVGRNHFDLFPNDENEAIFKKVRDTGETVEFKAKPFEYEDQPWRGVTYWDWKLVPVKGTVGRVTGLVLSLIDVTDTIRSKQLSDALNHINSLISSTLDCTEIMMMTVAEAGKAIRCESSEIFVRESNFWIARYVHGCALEPSRTRFTNKEAALLFNTGTKKPAVIQDSDGVDAEKRKLMNRHGIRSALSVPIVIKEELAGIALFSYRTEPYPISANQVDFASKLGYSVSLALENARLYTAEQTIADTLQEALLTVPDHIDGVDFGHLYRSATEATQVGGDFFDIFELEHDQVGIIIGDVSGKGLKAATLTSLVRNTIRAYAYDDIPPSSVMIKANGVIIKALPPSSFISIIFGVIDIKTGVFSYCCAGHPPAILKRRTGNIEQLEVSGPVVGVFPNIEFSDNEATIERGDILVLFTDGIIEARCENEFFGEDRLAYLINAKEIKTAKEMPRAIFGEVKDFTKGELSDDVAILAVSLL